VRALRGTDKDGDDLSAGQQRVGAQWHHVAIKIRGALLKHHAPGRGIFGRREEVEIPVEAFVLVLAVEEPTHYHNTNKTD
jgi:hypothetical protein